MLTLCTCTCFATVTTVVMHLCMFLHATEYHIVRLRVFNLQEKGYAVDVQNTAFTNENDQAQHCMVYKAE